MKKRIKKVQFKKGQDASQALLHKLIVNFISYGKIKTTQKRAKQLKATMDRLTLKAINQSNADKNVLLSYIRNKKMVDYMMNTVAKVFKGRIGGYTRLTKYMKRQGDNADVVGLSWVEAIDQFAPKLQKKVVKDEQSEPDLKTSKKEIIDDKKEKVTE